MKLNTKRTFFVGLAFMSICAFWQVYDGIIPKILKSTFEVSDTVAGGIMALDNVLALFLLPFFGILSDKTHTKIGRRMPYILIGTSIAVACLVLIPIADTARNFILFFIALGVILLAMSSYRSPAVALMPDVTPKPLRSKGNAVINLMGALGGAMMLGIIKFTVPETDHPNYMPLFVITAVFMAVCVIILFFTVSEPKAVVAMRKESKALGIDEEPELDSDGVEKKGLPKDVFKSLALIVITVFFFFMGYNAVTTAFSKYCEVVWGMKGGSYAGILLIATIASIVSYIPVGFIASKIGRKNTILVGLVLLAIAFGSATLFAEFSPAVYFFFCLAGIGYAFIIVNTLVMVVEMSRGSTIGKYTGYYYTLSMTAQIITPIASGAVLQFVGYQYLFPYAVVFEILAFVAMLFVKHGDSRPGAPKNKLEAFDIKD